VPFSSLEIKDPEGRGLFFNLYRVDGYPKQNGYQALFPTFCNPADFHVPTKFGIMWLK